MICSTKHHLKDCNRAKRDMLAMFIDDYSTYVNQVIDSIWANGYIHIFQDGHKCELNVDKEQFDLPSRIDHTRFKQFTTDISGRAQSAAADQAGSIIRSVTAKQRKAQFLFKKYGRGKFLPFSKPNPRLIYPNLASLCVDFQSSDNHFYGFMILKSIGKKYGTIKLPVIYNPNIDRNGGNLKAGCMIAPDFIQLVWDTKCPKNKNNKIVGADQGYKTILTLSDGQTTAEFNSDGHSLESIITTLSRRTKDSKGFKRAQDHRKNFINEQMNKLDFTNIGEVRLEEVKYLRKGQKTSRKMSHWAYTLIKTKLLRICESQKVSVFEQNSVYRSQRCSKCGYVHKSNRKGKLFQCLDCNSRMDADLNAACNHAADLPSAASLCNTGLNRVGFYWKTDGFYDCEGTKLLVSYNSKRRKSCKTCNFV